MLVERFTLRNIFISRGAGRFSIWKIGWIAFVHKPFLGYGYNNFPFVYDLYFPQVPIDYWSGIHQVAHNIYLQTFVELGIIGGILLLIISWQHWRLIRLLASGENLSMSTIEAIMLGILTASFFLGTLNYKYFWLSFSLIVLSVNVRRQGTSRNIRNHL